MPNRDTPSSALSKSPVSSVPALMFAVSVVGSNGLALSPILSDVARSFSTSALTISTAISAYGAATAASAFLLAARIDRIGIRRALLGAMAPAEREALASRLSLDRYTSQTVKTHKQLLRLIASEAERGWHVNLAEHQADTLSVAAPLVLYGTVLALVVGAPLDRSAAKADAIGQTLLAASRQLAQRIDTPAPLAR